jgi:HlyD family secretion protein
VAKNARAAKVRRRRLLRRGILGVVVLAVAGALAYAWRPRPVEVDVVTASRGDLLVTLDEMGKARVRDRYVVAAPLGGQLMRVEHRAGASVKEGEVLAQIVPLQPMLLDARSRTEAQARVQGAAAAQRQARAAVARAEIAAAHANDELARVRKLVEAESLAQNALVLAELDARLRTEELASARFAQQMVAHEAAMASAALRRFDPASAAADVFEVGSPAQGRVLRVLHESAGPVQPGTPLLEVGDPDALEIVSDVLTADAVQVKPGARTTIVRWGGETLPAHVRTVEPSAFTRLSALGVEEQRVAIVIDIDAPRERWTALGDGYRVEVRVVLADRPAVVRAPLAAVFRHGDGWAAYAVRGGRASLVPIRLGARGDALVEVEQGLADGDRVIVHPPERVAHDVRVAARE